MVQWVVGSILHGEPIALCFIPVGSACSSVVRVFALGAMDFGSILHGGPIEPVEARCSSVVRAFAHGAMCYIQ